jgi:hypothetical protein
MKKFFPTTVIARVQAQSSQTKLDQFKLMQGWIGTWQRVIGKDTVQVLEFQQYGKGFIQDLYLLINGKKSIQGKACYSFSAKRTSSKCSPL